MSNEAEIDWAKEWRYWYEERLGILCGADKPTAEQEALARKEADAQIKKLRAR